MNDVPSVKEPDLRVAIKSIALEAANSNNRLTALADAMVQVIEQSEKNNMIINQIKSDLNISKERIKNLDSTNINGTERQRLNHCIRKYARDKGIFYSVAWNEFKRRFNTSFHCNIEARIENYCKKSGVKKISLPEYLELADLLEDALRVADKMLN